MIGSLKDAPTFASVALDGLLHAAGLMWDGDTGDILRPLWLEAKTIGYGRREWMVYKPSHDNVSLTAPITIELAQDPTGLMAVNIQGGAFSPDLEAAGVIQGWLSLDTGQPVDIMIQQVPTSQLVGADLHQAPIPAQAARQPVVRLSRLRLVLLILAALSVLFHFDAASVVFMASYLFMSWDNRTFRLLVVILGVAMLVLTLIAR